MTREVGFGSLDQSGPAMWDLERYRTSPGTVVEPNIRDRRKTHAEYTADGWTLFWMCIRTAFLSIITLGIYRFWMVTHLRRHYLGGIQLNGDPLEYTGSGLEKLLGFLLALVFLAVYLGLVNLGLTFLGLSFTSDDPWQANLVLNLSVLSTLPLIFYAQYRSMGYMLSRTRWRGIRFGLDPGAWGYVVRGVLLSFLTVVTAGLAYPYQHFTLARYMTDRAWFGDLQFYQEGSWTELFASWIWIYILGAFSALSIYTLYAFGAESDLTTIVLSVIIYFVSITMLYLTMLRYRFYAFKVLWDNKSVGDVEFDSEFGVGNAVGVYITASFLSPLAAILTLIVMILLMAILFWVTGYWYAFDTFYSLITDPKTGQELVRENFDGQEAFGFVFPFLVITYLVMICVVFAVSQVFFFHRILRRKVETTIIHNHTALSGSLQREHQSSTEAGGFADALGVDVGGGF